MLEYVCCCTVCFEYISGFSQYLMLIH